MAQNKRIPAWKPTDEGTVITGKVAKINERDLLNEYGAQEYTQLIIQNDDDELIAINCIGASLRRCIEWAKPKVGDRLMVGYIGERKTDSGNTFKKYNMRNITAMADNAA